MSRLVILQKPFSDRLIDWLIDWLCYLPVVDWSIFAFVCFGEHSTDISWWIFAIVLQLASIDGFFCYFFVERGSKSSTGEIKWNNNILETARRLRGMRMSEDSNPTTNTATTDTAFTPPLGDEVFFTPLTSFPTGRPHVLSLDESLGKNFPLKLDFDQSSDEMPPATPNSREGTKMHWQTVAQVRWLFN